MTSLRLPIPVLEPKGPHAQAIEQLWWVFLWTTTAVFALVLVALAVAVWRGRHAASTDTTPTPPEPSRDRRLEQVVAASSAVSLAILAALLIASIVYGRRLTDGAPVEPLRVKVTAHQWWWELEYRAERPDLVFTTANELHLPAGRPVEIELSTADVIHSFWIPELDGKHDLIPSRTTKMWIAAQKPGRFGGRCAEFCGLQHANMDLDVVVERPADFERWRARARSEHPEPRSEASRRGRELVERGPCAMCHTVAGTEAAASVGPNLTGLAERRRIGAGALDNRPENLAAWIENPQRYKAGVKMPAIGLPRSELDAIVSYLEERP